MALSACYSSENADEDESQPHASQEYPSSKFVVDTDAETDAAAADLAKRLTEAGDIYSTQINELHSRAPIICATGLVHQQELMRCKNR